MKKVILFALSLLLLTSTGYAQNNKDQRKEREAITKMSDKELKAKVGRDIKKQAKEFKKQGWQVNVGALSLEKQIEKSQRMQYEYNDDNSPKYFMGEMTAKAESYADCERSSFDVLVISDIITDAKLTDKITKTKVANATI